MSDPTDKLIERLSGEARPVRPQLSPVVRSLVILVPLLAAMVVYIAMRGHTTSVMQQMADPVFTIGLVASLATGIIAIVAALYVSVPGRAGNWPWAPVIPALAWFSAGFWECATYVRHNGIHDYDILASLDCFMFIGLTGTAIALLLFAVLRNSVVSNLFGITALCGLGAATLGNTLLTFFHPPGTNPVDFVTHLTAVTALVTYMATLGRAAIRGG
jgi:hypothetical protein